MDLACFHNLLYLEGSWPFCLFLSLNSSWTSTYIFVCRVVVVVSVRRPIWRCNPVVHPKIRFLLVPLGFMVSYVNIKRRFSCWRRWTDTHIDRITPSVVLNRLCLEVLIVNRLTLRLGWTLRSSCAPSFWLNSSCRFVIAYRLVDSIDIRTELNNLRLRSRLLGD